MTASYFQSAAGQKFHTYTCNFQMYYSLAHVSNLAKAHTNHSMLYIEFLLLYHLFYLLQSVPLYIAIHQEFSKAKAAFVAAAPLNVEIAVPVEATPKVVAIPIAAVGPIAATATPALTPAAPAPAFFTAAVL